MDHRKFFAVRRFAGLAALIGLAFAALLLPFPEIEARAGARESRFYPVGLVLKARADGKPVFEIGLYRAENGRYRFADRFAFDQRCSLDRLADTWIENSRLIALDPIPHVSLTDPASGAAAAWAGKAAEYVNWQYGGVFGRMPENLDACFVRYWLYLQRKHAGLERNGLAKAVSPKAVRPEAPAR